MRDGIRRACRRHLPLLRPPPVQEAPGDPLAQGLSPSRRPAPSLHHVPTQGGQEREGQVVGGGEGGQGDSRMATEGWQDRFILKSTIVLLIFPSAFAVFFTLT